MTHPSPTADEAAGLDQPNQEPESRLKHFPNAFFAMVMGLAGFTLAGERLEKSLGMHHSMSLALLVVSGAVFTILLGIYILKAFRYPKEVIWEWHHPVRMCFFPAISIGLLLIATALLPFTKSTALGIWAIGSILHLIGTLAVLSAWIGHRDFEMLHLNPAWFIPVVGNIIVPITGARLGYVETSWFFFSIGLVFWMVLLSLVFNRLIFHHPMQGRLLPTLMIMIAPPAVGFISYVTMTGALDAFARILYYTGVFFTLIILLQAPKLAKIPFAMSWWAYSFPMAALTISTLLFAEKANSSIHNIAGMVLFGLLSLVILGLLLRTAKAIMNRKVCMPE